MKKIFFAIVFIFSVSAISVAQTCNNPYSTDINIIAITATNVTFTIQTRSGVNDYNWKIYDFSGGTIRESGNIVNTSSGSTVTITSTTNTLAQNQKYGIGIQANCNAGLQSIWINHPYGFYLTCSNTTTLPWSEGFSVIGNNVLPACWRAERGLWKIGVNSGGGTGFNLPPRNGFAGANLLSYTGSNPSTNLGMWTPPFQLLAGEKYRFNFWMITDGFPTWSASAMVNTSQFSNGATTLSTPFVSNNFSNPLPNYQQISRDFVPNSTGIYYFGIKIDNLTQKYVICFDDFSVVKLTPCATIPALGNTLSSKGNEVCNNNATILSLATTFSSNLDYQWQSSSDSLNWTDIIDAKSNTYLANITASQWYRLAVNCGSGNVSYSIPIHINLTLPNLCYCLPLHTTATIKNVTIGTINQSKTASKTPYYGIKSQTTTLFKGAKHKLSVNGNSGTVAAQLSAWIDFDQSGTFDLSERVLHAPNYINDAVLDVTVDVPSFALSGKTGMRVLLEKAGNPLTSCPNTFQIGETEDYIITIADALKLNAKIYLNNFNSNTLMMDASLKTLPNFPLSNPYNIAPLSTTFQAVPSNQTVQNTTASTLNTTGANAIIDWLFVALRDGISGSSTVTCTRAALLQADGDIVDMDGISSLEFPNIAVGDYFISIKHRNHLGMRTAGRIGLFNFPTYLDFTNNTVPLFGISPMNLIANNLSTMIGGDANSDGSIDSTDAAIWETQNGSFDDYTLRTDYNLDGSVDSTDSAIWELNNGKYEELD